MKESVAANDVLCKLMAWAYVILAVFAVAAIAFVATRGGKELSDGWPIFFVVGAAFSVHSIGIIAQGDLLLPGITTVRRNTQPFFFWILLTPNILFGVGIISLGVWSILR